jgi:hypothetical protein
MFSDAAELHLNCLARIGQQLDARTFTPSGCGCALDAAHTLTAWHVVSPTIAAGEQIIVYRRDGVYAACPIWSDDREDLCVLRSTGTIRSDENRVESYPALARALPFVGTPVGTVSLLRLPEEFQGYAVHQFFSAGHIAAIFPAHDAESLRLALTPLLVQRGFSGSPVFLQDGSIAGIVTGFLTFRIEPSEPRYHFTPLVVPIGRFHSVILDSL